MEMKYVTLGNTDIRVSAAGLGTWAIGGDSQWGESDDATSIRTIQEAIEQGITYIDTAPAYGLGHSEEVVGKAVKGRRDKCVIATKCGLIWDDTEGCCLLMHRDGVDVCRNLAPESIMLQVEQSLRRLDMDYIDVLITHWQSLPPNQTPIAETMGALSRLVEQGKIRAIGMSNVTPEQIDEYAANGTISLVQQKYSMLDRAVETNGIMDACERHSLTFQPYSPLERGLLSGKVTMDTVITGNAKKSMKLYEPENRARVIAMLEQFRPLCEKYQCSMASLVIAWTIARKPYMQVICGARKPEQIIDNAAGGRVEIEPADLEKMNQLAKECIMLS